MANPLLKLTGTPYEFGYTHGQAYHDAIHKFTEERVRLSSDEHWTGHSLPRAEILELAAACLDEHRAFAPELVEELQGMADATGLGLPELIIMNGFTDFIDLVFSVAKEKPTATRPMDNCTAFLIPANATANGHGYFGQTWDMHSSAMPYVLLIEGRPADGIPFLTFTTTGCVGMIGMNAAGIAVGINNIMGGDGQIGVTWPFVVRKMLAQSTIEDALEVLTSAKLAGSHNYLLFDKHSQGYNIEAMSSRFEVEPLDDAPIVHTNHCLVPRNKEVERERPEKSLESSLHRLSRGQELFEQRPLSVALLMEATRDEEAICVQDDPELHVATCGAAIMSPATGEFWAVQGLPNENEYERFAL